MKKYLIIFGILGIGFYIGTLAAYILKDDINSEFLGQVGDFLGGFLNPLFALLSFIALLITIVFQSEELKNSREELKLTREELAKSAEAQEKSAQIFEQQRFENTFFSLLETVKSSIKDFKQNSKWYLEPKNFNIPDCNDLRCVEEFSKVAMLIYQILRFIDNYDKNQNNIDTKKYSNILRSYLDADILQLLAISCYSDDIYDIYKFRDLIKKYTLLKHMPLIVSKKMNPFITMNSGDFLLKVVDGYIKGGHKEVFGENQYIKNLNFNS